MQENSQYHKNNTEAASSKRVDGIKLRSNKELDVPLVYAPVPQQALVRVASKLVGSALVAIALFIGIWSIGDTVSYFADTEFSIGNTLRAGGLEIFLSQVAALRLAAVGAGSEDVGQTSFDVSLDTGDSTLPVAYALRGELDADMLPQCGEIVVDAALDGATSTYSGPLSSFASPAVDTAGTWHITLSVPASSTLPYDALCTGSIVFDAHIKDIAEEVRNTYSDQKKHAFAVRNVSAPAPVVQTIAPQSEVMGTSTGSSTPSTGDSTPPPPPTESTSSSTPPVVTPPPPPEASASSTPAAPPPPEEKTEAPQPETTSESETAPPPTPAPEAASPPPETPPAQ